MREIRFRQRNINNGHFHYWGIVGDTWVNPKTADNYVSPDRSNQFIGEVDRNGKYLYENDIVAWGCPDIGTCMQVVREGGLFLQTAKGMLPDMWYDWDEVKLVGNIYENENLL